MAEDQFHKGVVNTVDALKRALRDRSVEDPQIEHSESPSEPTGLTITVSANGKTLTQQFDHDEILDSGEAIDAPVAVKVRMMVSHFL